MKEGTAQVGRASAVDKLLLEQLDEADVAVKKLDAASYMIDTIAANPSHVDPSAVEGLALIVSECARTVELLSLAAHKKIYEP